MMSKKRVLSCAVISTVVGLSSFPSMAYAQWTQGYDGQSQYSTLTNNQCSYGDRAGYQYVQKLQTELSNWAVANNGTAYIETHAWKTDLTDGFADSNNFFAFGGHGLPASTYSNGRGGGLHFFNVNSNTVWHSYENQPEANAQWDDLRWGKNKMRWATLYSCRFLTNEGSTTNEQKIWNMFQGIHLMLGFATRMYLDSREGDYYGFQIANGLTIKNAFMEAAAKYQVQLPYSQTTSSPAGSVIARVKGNQLFMNDDKNTDPSAASLPYASYNASDFVTVDSKITVTNMN